MAVVALAGAPLGPLAPALGRPHRRWDRLRLARIGRRQGRWLVSPPMHPVAGRPV